ncbi:helix-turn-helix transcriptional regulator [Selenomonas ruminantium]|uniref:helix-turn-helix transcriptional regulator n=1 Tax=Selenomonas ruminantium TaxID=971 RepID=UPI0026F0E670|nr:helix-turn-helix transcriptional regulator [Selenomonas ruminantium]
MENKRILEALRENRTMYVKAVRKTLNKTQQEMADILGISRPTYNKEENSERISELFYVAIGSYWDNCYKNYLNKWVNNKKEDNSEVKECKNKFKALTKLLNKKNFYRVYDKEPTEKDIDYFLKSSFNDEWWNAINKSDYNTIPECELESYVENGEVWLNCEGLDSNTIDGIIKKLSYYLEVFNKKIYLLTDKNHDYYNVNLKELESPQNEEDKIKNVISRRLNYIDLSYSGISFQDFAKHIFKFKSNKENSSVLLISNHKELLNDIRFVNNKKVKIISNKINEIIKEKKINQKYLIDFRFNRFVSDTVIKSAMWNNGYLKYNDLYFEEFDHGIPNDAIAIFLIFNIIIILDEVDFINKDDQEKIISIIKEELSLQDDFFKDGCKAAFEKYLNS